MGCLGIDEKKNTNNALIQMQKIMEENNKKMKEEMARTDLYVLQNAENMEGIKLVKLKPAVKKKFQFIKKKCKPIIDRQKYKLKFTNELSKYSSIQDFKENRYGIDNNTFIDVFDLSNDNFLFRFKPFNEDMYIYIYPLLDGTFLYDGRVNIMEAKFVYKIFSIIENKAYQIHYEIEMLPFQIQLTDERIVGCKHCTIALYAKDSTGKFQKTVENEIPNSKSSLCNFHQVRDNLLVATGFSSIYFIETTKLEVTNCLAHDSTQTLGFIAENLLIVKNKYPKRQYALIDINKKQIIDYATKSEREAEETKKERYKRGLSFDLLTKDEIIKMDELPDHSIIMSFEEIEYKDFSYKHVYYDEKSGEIIEKEIPLERFPDNNKYKKIEVKGILENGNVYLKIGFDPVCLYK